jgi:tol-pal system protein YbgF
MKKTAPVVSVLAASVLLVSSALSGAAFAQTDSQAIQRMERLENDLQVIQRQLARGGTITTGSSGEPIANTSQLEVRLGNIEDEIRHLRGKTEEAEFQVRKLSENMEKMQRDMELRLNELDAATKEAAKSPKEPASKPAASSTKEADAGAEDEESEQSGDFATPREHYNHAFRLLNQTKYSEAAESFAEFTKKHPKDPLVGNAYYWMGETFYIRRDYVNAADMFRQGFEAIPDGPKASDNLLKLAMSLSALKRDKEACVVLQQISTRFKKKSNAIAERALQEQKRIDCKAQ